MNYGQFVRFAEKTRHFGADKLTQITVLFENRLWIDIRIQVWLLII